MKFQRYKFIVNNYKAFKETKYHEQEPANRRIEPTETSDIEMTRYNYEIVCLITLKVKRQGLKLSLVVRGCRNAQTD